MTGTGGLAGRAARQTALNNHRTPDSVGPGAYTGHTQHQVRPRLDAPIFFLASWHVNKLNFPSAVMQHFPAPNRGHYILSKVPHQVRFAHIRPYP